MSRWKDTLGIVASVGCAIHSAATPILLACLPALKLTEWMASPQFHQVAALVCCSLVAISIWPSFRKFRDYRVLSLSSAGLGLVISAAFFLPDHCCDHSNGTVVPGMKLVSSTSQANRSDSTVCNDACCQNNVFAARRAVLMGTTVPTNLNTIGSTDVLQSTSAANTEPLAIEPLALKEHVHSTSFWGTVQPWMTPLGGLLLVLAHTLNLRRSLASRRCGTACGCSNARPTLVSTVSTPSENTLAA